MLADQADIVYEFCKDAGSALTVATNFQPTVILQDLIMPSIDGLDMVRKFRSVPATASVPVIVLSAREEAVVKAQLFEAGANDYLVKLPDKIELIARIRVHSDAYKRLLERNSAFDALERSLVALKQEQEKSERLLLNILPQKIADRLKNSEATIAESFPAVSVIFAFRWRYELAFIRGPSSQVLLVGISLRTISGAIPSTLLAVWNRTVSPRRYTFRKPPEICWRGNFDLRIGVK